MKISVGNSPSDVVNFETVEIKNIEQLAETITATHYSLGTFKNGYRKKDNFIETSVIGLDFDEGLTLEQATERYKEFSHIIAPTRSHQVEKNGKTQDRFRVILFLSEPIKDAELFESTWFSLAKMWPELDRACKDASRFFYPSKFVHSIRKGGKRIEPVARVVEPAAAPKEVSLSAEGKGELAKRTLKFLLNGAPKGQKHHELYYSARDSHQNGYDAEWFFAQMEALAARTGDEDYIDSGSKKTIADAFSKEPKHEARVEESAFRLTSIADIYEDETEIEWVVEDLLMKGGLSLMSADPKAGKSTTVRQLIRDVLRGGVFFGRRCVQGPVHYYAMEEHPAVLKKSFKRLDITPDDNLLIHVGDINSDDGMEEFGKIIREMKPTLAAVDTLFDLVTVENENAYGEIKRKLKKLRQIARDSGTHIIAVHHNGKGGDEGRRRGNSRILGSQAISGGVDSIIVIELEGTTRKITTSGREVKQWNQRNLVWDYKTATYSLGPDIEEF